MEHYLLPYGLEKKDTLYGTIVSSGRVGVTIRLEIDTDEEQNIPAEVLAFAYANGNPGQRVLVSLMMFNERFNNFKVKIDSYLTQNEETHTIAAARYSPTNNRQAA